MTKINYGYFIERDQVMKPELVDTLELEYSVFQYYSVENRNFLVRILMNALTKLHTGYSYV